MAFTRDIRTSYLLFPAWVQSFLTWMTGKPLKHQQPLFILGAWFHFLCPMLMVLVGGYLIVWILSVQSAAFLCVIPCCWLLMLSGGRKLALTVRHQCAHHMFTGHKKLDIFLSEFSTTILCAQDACTYKKDHAHLHHKISLLAGFQDPHVKVLLKHGFMPGMTKQALWSHLFRTLISPVFHFRYTLDRLKYNFIRATPIRRIASWLYWGIILVLLSSHTLSIVDFIMAYIIPIILFYNMSALLEIISEHPFSPTEEVLSPKERSQHFVKMWGIMCGAPLPSNNIHGVKKAYLWMVWFIRMIGHLVIRCTILCGDLSAHDLHHRKPGKYDWRIAIYERQKEIDKEDGTPSPPYRDIWGFWRAIDLVFESYSLYLSNCKENETMSNLIV